MKEQLLEALRRPLVLFGVLLVGVGGVLLLYLGIMVFQVINNPEKVKIVEFVLRHIQIDDKAIFGRARRAEIKKADGIVSQQYYLISGQ